MGEVSLGCQASDDGARTEVLSDGGGWGRIIYPPPPPPPKMSHVQYSHLDIKF